jgi:two-component system response regulator AlgR
MAASFGGIIRRIALADIHYLHADDKYTIVHHRGGEHVLDQSLKDLEQQHPLRLLRIHRNCLVNRAQLAELRRDGEGRIWAQLKDSPRPLEVSRRCAGELKDWFKGN